MMILHVRVSSPCTSNDRSCDYVIIKTVSGLIAFSIAFALTSHNQYMAGRREKDQYQNSTSERLHVVNGTSRISCSYSKAEQNCNGKFYRGNN